MNEPNTPTTAQRVLRPRHTPTPKMSERKKSLFAGGSGGGGNSNKSLPQPMEHIDEDSDLGPMSPLQFSCSPTTHNGATTTTPRADATTRRPTDFRNIMLQLSPAHRRGRPISERYEAIYDASADATPSSHQRRSPVRPPSADDVMSTTNTSPSSSGSVGGGGGISSEDDDGVRNKENFAAAGGEKTPSVPVKLAAEMLQLRSAHRKQLAAYDSGSKTPQSTNDAGATLLNSDSMTLRSPDTDGGRARASLKFAGAAAAQAEATKPASSGVGISVRSFYGSAFDATKRQSMSASTSRPSTSSSAARRSVPNHHNASTSSTGKRRGRPPGHTNAHSSAHHRHSVGPVLGRSVPAHGHRIARPKPPAASAASLSTTLKRTTAGGAVRKFNSRAEVIAAALALIDTHAQLTQRLQNTRCVTRSAAPASASTASATTSPPSTSTFTSPSQKPTTEEVEANQITQLQIDKLQRILAAQPPSTAAYALASRPLNWLGTGSGGGSASPSTHSEAAPSANTTLADDTFGHMSVLLDQTAPINDTMSLQDETTAAAPKRKFFKSGDKTNAHQYTVMKGMCASVKRGAGVQLLSPPQKKRPRHADYAELRAINQEVSDIIGMLETLDDDPSELSVNSSSDPIDAALAALHNDEPAAEVAQPTLFQDPLASLECFGRFSQLLPYNTADPETEQRQRTLLNLLYTNEICSEHTFRVFIAEPERHEAEATRILDQLFQLDVQTDAVAADGKQLSPTTHISTLTSAMELGDDGPSTAAAGDMETTLTDSPSSTAAAAADSKLFPIFNRATANATAPDAAAGATTNILSAAQQRRPITWSAYGRRDDARQLQLDAGQRRFGGAACAECGMFYARHEPEDERLHAAFHSLAGRLQFRGWQDERVVAQVPEWGEGGRVVVVRGADARVRRVRVAEIVRLVDEQLGVPEVERAAEMAEALFGGGAMIYLAIAQRRVVGVCVAEPLDTAYAVRLESGVPMQQLGDQREVRCGLSRMWVLEAFRRLGVGRRLFEAAVAHFLADGGADTLGAVAFGAPTEAGCAFAAHVMGGMDRVLVY